MRKFSLLLDKMNKYVDYTGLYYIGILSLGFLLYRRTFAKFHIDLSFIKTPFFVGDITFVICACLFFLKWLVNPKKFKLNTYLFLLYFGFVIIKTIVGYSNWGSLSLRHAVLFCYPIFAIFSYSFYRSDFFEPKKVAFLIFAFIWILKFSGFNLYYSLTVFILLLILIKTYPVRLMRYIMFCLLLLVFPYTFLFDTSRTFLIANLFAIVYMVLGYFYFIKIKRVKKIVILALFFSFVGFGVIKIGRSNDLKSLVSIKQLAEGLKNDLELIRIEEATFVPEKLAVKLYQEEGAGFTEQFEQDTEPPPLSSKKGIENQDFSVIENNAVPRLTTRYGDKTAGPVVAVESKNYQPPSSSVPVIENNAVPRLTTRYGDKTAGPVVAVESKNYQPPSSSVPVIENNAVPRLTTRYGDKTAGPVVAVESKNYQPEYFNKFGLYKQRRGKADITLDEEQEKAGAIPNYREIADARATSIFRLLIWRDVFKEITLKHPIFGFDFGKPFRSISLEITGNAWGEWMRDGWICLHNSYIDIIYRAGIPGVLIVVFILIFFSLLVVNSFQKRSLTGVLLTGILLNWFVAANFLEILEMPYSGIPLWSLFGLTAAYLFKNKTL